MLVGTAACDTEADTAVIAAVAETDTAVATEDADSCPPPNP